MPRCGSAALNRHSGKVMRADLPGTYGLRRLRRQRELERVHGLGPRVIGELLNELAREHGIGRDIAQRVARYAARLSPELLRAVGGDRFPAAPLHAVGRR
jgi:hypothetical protein